MVESTYDYTYVINQKSHMRIGFAFPDVSTGRACTGKYRATST